MYLSWLAILDHVLFDHAHHRYTRQPSDSYAAIGLLLHSEITLTCSILPLPGLPGDCSSLLTDGNFSVYNVKHQEKSKAFREKDPSPPSPSLLSPLPFLSSIFRTQDLVYAYAISTANIPQTFVVVETSSCCRAQSSLQLLITQAGLELPVVLTLPPETEISVPV